MGRYIEVVAIVEGRTEQTFIEKLLAPYLGHRGIYLHATQLSKPGEKGGDVKFSRAKRDLGNHLKQRPDTFITTMVDYYGVKEWPGIERVPERATPDQIATTINSAPKKKVVSLFTNSQTDYRFIPFILIHEFEALLFSDSEILANQLGAEISEIAAVISKFGNPEAINSNPETAPSKRLDKWSPGKRFLKTTMGIKIAEEIGIDKMRQECPQFDSWLSELEDIRNSLK